MGKLISSLQIVGTFDMLSIYKMKGHDQLIVRKSGGPSSKAVKTHKKFEHTRFNNSEFGGRSVAVKQIRNALGNQKALADYNIAGPLNQLLRPLQVTDPVNNWGQRSVMITQNPSLLRGFNLNRKNNFDTIVRTPPDFTISRESLSAVVQLPALFPGINFIVPGKYPMYQFIVVMGVVSDAIYNKDHKKYYTKYNVRPKEIRSEWFACMKGSPAKEMELSFDTTFADPSFSLVLSLGIAFGTMDDENHVKQIQYAGAAKIVGVV